MFERFTDRARKIVVLAQEEARRLNHDYIGTEHLLLGIIREGQGLAVRALEALEISLEDVQSRVEEIIGEGQVSPSGHIPFTPAAKKALELSLRESLQIGHDYIGTEHILLGLIREGGTAAQVLTELGADVARVRQRVRAWTRSALAGRQETLEARLEALERWVGMQREPEDVDLEIKQVRRNKEAAIDDQDFETAARLRGEEKRLMRARAARDREWAKAHKTPLAQELSQLTAEVGRLRTLLREHGFDPGDDAPGDAASAPGGGEAIGE